MRFNAEQVEAAMTGIVRQNVMKLVLHELHRKASQEEAGVDEKSPALQACHPRYASAAHEALAGAHLVLDQVDEDEARRWRPVLELLEAALEKSTQSGTPPRSRARSTQ